MSITYKVECDNCKTQFTANNEDEFFDEDIPRHCVYCGEDIEEINIEEIE